MLNRTAHLLGKLSAAIKDDIDEALKGFDTKVEDDTATKRVHTHHINGVVSMTGDIKSVTLNGRKLL